MSDPTPIDEALASAVRKAVQEALQEAQAADDAAARAAAQAEIDRQRLREGVLEDQKAASFYEVAVNAWVNSALELDKNLLTLASGAIAFSLTFVEPLRGSELFLFFYFLSIILFMVTIFSALAALKLNCAYIDDLVNRKPNTGKALSFFDRTAMVSFGVGVLMLAVVGSISVMKRNGDTAMSEQSKKSESVEIIKSVARLDSLGTSFIGESVNGLSGMMPKQPAQALVANPQTAPTPGTLLNLAPKPTDQK